MSENTDSSETWLDRPSIIQRQRWPGRYAGMNAQGFPTWTSAYEQTKQIPAREAQEELNNVARHEPKCWAILFPQSAPPDHIKD